MLITDDEDDGDDNDYDDVDDNRDNDDENDDNGAYSHPSVPESASHHLSCSRIRMPNADSEITFGFQIRIRFQMTYSNMKKWNFWKFDKI